MQLLIALLQIGYNRIMVKRYISKIITGLLTIGFGVALVTAPVSALGEGGAPAGINAARGDNTPSNLANGDSSIVRRAINIMLFGVGVLSVVMLIFGGFRYVISGGKKEICHKRQKHNFICNHRSISRSLRLCHNQLHPWRSFKRRINH